MLETSVNFSKSTSKDTDTSQILFWVLLGVVFLLVVFYIIFKIFWKKRKKRKEKKLLKKIQDNIELKEREFAIKIQLLIEKNNTLVEKFIPSVGKYKMSDLDKIAKSIIFGLIKSANFKEIQKAGDNTFIFTEKLKNLYKNRSSNWAKYNKDEIKYFTEKANSFKDNEDYVEIVEREEIFMNSLYKNEFAQ